MSIDPRQPDSSSRGAPRYHDLIVDRVIHETGDAASIVLVIPEDLRTTFAYKAGQFLTFEIPFEGSKLYRCYSLASSPDVDSEHKVTVKRVVDGRISNWINDNVRAGDVLRALPPAGQFTFHEHAHDIILFAGGSGITPCISIIKTALAGEPRRVKLVYANRDRNSVIFESELAELAAEHPKRFEIVHRFDDEHGFLDDRAVRSQIDGRAGAWFYMCGPGPFMDIIEDTLHRSGVDAERIRLERFSSPPDGEAIVEGAPERAARAAVDVDAPFVEIRLDGEDHRVPIRDGETLLQAARNAGLQPPFSCQSGFCGCCMAKLVEGEATMIINDFLENDDLAEGWILTCQAVRNGGRCRIEYPD